MKMIQVLIVEDSRVVSEYLQHILNSCPEINVIGNVSNGRDAIDFLKSNQPDIITMDINMPIMNGLEATRKIMATTPVPIIIVSASQNIIDVKVSMDALSAGALAVIEKPAGIGHPNEKSQTEKLINIVKVMSEVKVITRRLTSPLTSPVKKLKPGKTGVLPSSEKFSNAKLIVIGVSSGGPQVLQKIFSGINEDFPLPIVVVQHISKGFLPGLINWLETTSKIPFHIAQQNETILPGHVYFAPNNFQMGVSCFGKIELSKCDKEFNVCPSVSYLFNRIQNEYGEKVMAIILTGMGSDGALELKKLREAGAITIAQDKESAMIYGMPGVAAQIGAAEFILSTDQITELLNYMEHHAQISKLSKSLKDYE